jgi:dienelactone hydrolase
VCLAGYLFESAEGKSKGVAIIVIQEWWGINDEIKQKGALSLAHLARHL